MKRTDCRFYGIRAVAICVFAGLLSLLLACAGAQVRPAYLDNPALHPQYGNERFLKDVGVSEKSQADAEQTARARVAAQVRSSLEAVMTSHLESIRRGAPETTIAEYKKVVTTKTSFERAELIRVAPGAGHREKGAFFAFAYLDKQEFGAVVQPEYEREAAAFCTYVSQARNAYGLEDPASFAENYRAAGSAYAALEEKARMLYIAQGGPYAPHRRNEEAFLSVLAQKMDLKNRLRFYLVFVGPESETGRKKIRDVFQGLFSRAGLSANLCSACPCQGPLDYRFRVETTETQKEGVLGPVCTLKLSAKVLVCRSEHVAFQMELSSGKLKGAHTSDPEQALAKLYSQMDEAALYEKFKNSLENWFPL